LWGFAWRTIFSSGLIHPHTLDKTPSGGDEIDAMRENFIPSPGVGVNFGYSVASAGDVNGDGFADAIVRADAYSSYTGRAYIYFGGTTMNTAPDVILMGGTTNSVFGYSVSTAGDVNGDRYADVIVGAYSYSTSTVLFLIHRQTQGLS
jgi:FG-GAP repeat